VSEQLGVGAAVRRVREARGITLRALAASLGVSPATLSELERDRAPVTITRLARLAEVLDVAVSDLLNPADRPDPSASVRPAAGASGSARTSAYSASSLPAASWREFDDMAMDPILQAATRLFVAHGFHATSVRAVAAEAGLSVAGVYHHHPSKEHLLVALLDTTMAEIVWRLEAARAAGRDAIESLALMVESLALFHAVRGDLAFLGASEMRGLGERERLRVTALRDDVQRALDDQARAATSRDDVRVATRAIATMCTALPSWYRPDGPIAPQEIAARYAGYALAMLGLPAAR